LTATLIQSPSQSFWISSVSSSAIAIVQATTASYVNETNVSSSLYYFLFKVSTTDIDSSTITQYTTTTTQPEFSMSVGDKIVAAYFGSSDSVPSKTVAIYHGGTSSYSYIEAPLITRHNDLRGLQGGSTDEYYHLTQGEYIRFQSNSSSFASASISSSYSLNASSSINSTSASYLSGAYAIVNTLSASFITASAFVPPTDNTGTLGSLLMRWANAFINTISASYVYVSNIFGGTNDNDSLTLKGSTTNTGSVYINPIGGQVILGSELHGNKLVNLTNGSYTTVLNVYVPQNESVNVDMSLHGSWPTSGSIGYDVEMILSKGDVSTEYSQPGIILYQNNHNSNNYVMAQIVDAGLSAGSASFQIQLASSGSNVTNAKLVYDIKGTLLAAM
jgi:hypothetical protein